MNENQIRNYAGAAARQAANSVDGFGRAIGFTTDATPLSIISILTQSNSVGIIWCSCVGSDVDQNSFTVIRQAIYKNIAGVLTIGTPEDSLTAASDFTTADLTFDDDSENLLIVVTGEAATDINWKIKYTVTDIKNEVAL